MFNLKRSEARLALETWCKLNGYPVQPLPRSSSDIKDDLIRGNFVAKHITVARKAGNTISAKQSACVADKVSSEIEATRNAKHKAALKEAAEKEIAEKAARKAARKAAKASATTTTTVFDGNATAEAIAKLTL